MSVFEKLAAAAVVLLVAAGSASAEEQKTLRVAVEGTYPPFNYVDAGELKGFDVDIANAICGEVKMKCEFVVQEWDGMIPGLVANKYDAIIASMIITEERKKIVNFSDRYISSPATFTARVDELPESTSPEALTGKTIGVQGGTTHADFLTDKYTGSELRRYTIVDDLNADLVSGRIDYGFVDLALFSDWKSKSADGDCCVTVGDPINDYKAVGEGKGIAIRKEDEDLLKNVNKAIATILENGTYKTINEKYFPFSIY